MVLIAMKPQAVRRMRSLYSQKRRRSCPIGFFDSVIAVFHDILTNRFGPEGILNRFVIFLATHSQLKLYQIGKPIGAEHDEQR